MKKNAGATATRNHGAMGLRLVKPGEEAERRQAAPLTLADQKTMKAVVDEEAARRKMKRPIDGVSSSNKLAYSVSEAAAALGVSEWYIRDEISHKMIAVSKARGRLIIPRWELVRYLKENMQGCSVPKENDATMKDAVETAPEPTRPKAKPRASATAVAHKRMI